MANNKDNNVKEVSYEPFRAHEIFSLNRIARITGINKDKIYNNAKCISKSNKLSGGEIKDIKKVIQEAQRDFFDQLDTER